MKKTIILISVIQCFILLSFLAVLYKTEPLDIAAARQCNIVVEKISYRRRYNESSLYVYDNSIGYRFSKGALASEYNSVRDISEALNEGDILTITYIEEQGIFGKTNLVIDAFSENEEYLSYRQYNSEKRLVRNVLTIFFGFFELIFIAIAIFISKLIIPVKNNHKKEGIKHKRS